MRFIEIGLSATRPTGAGSLGCSKSLTWESRASTALPSRMAISDCFTGPECARFRWTLRMNRSAPDRGFRCLVSC